MHYVCVKRDDCKTTAVQRKYLRKIKYKEERKNRTFKKHKKGRWLFVQMFIYRNNTHKYMYVYNKSYKFYIEVYKTFTFALNTYKKHI